MKDWLKIILAACILFILLLVAKMVSPSDQQSDITFSGLIPPAGKYAVKTSILGKTIEGQINLSHNTKTSGSFDFQMVSPILFTCPSSNRFTANIAAQTVEYSLDQCTVDRLNQNDLTLKGMAYDASKNVLKVDLVWKKVVPLTLLMNYQA
jgi:hypothetical protein